MSGYNYSIIIPHKNLPALLQRCLDSIPARDDVQIIVVDDDSNPGIVDFENFPGLDRANTEVYFDKTGRGAGHARNIGLQHAKGKWLVFADADDFFADGFLDVMDASSQTTSDIVYFNSRSVMSDDVNCPSCRDERPYLFQQFVQTGDESLFRCDCPQPWGRMTRRSFSELIKARFDETKYSNDYYYDIYTGVKAGSIDVNDAVVYIVTERTGSLTHDFCGTIEEWYIRFEVACRVRKIIEKKKYCYSRGTTTFFWDILCHRFPNLRYKVLLHYWNNPLVLFYILWPIIRCKISLICKK